jgi:hypothetical protein
VFVSNHGYRDRMKLQTGVLIASAVPASGITSPAKALRSQSKNAPLRTSSSKSAEARPSTRNLQKGLDLKYVEMLLGHRDIGR